MSNVPRMRRVITLLVALLASAVATPGASAVPPKGELVLIADGPSYATVDFPKDVYVNFQKADVPPVAYALFVASHAGQAVLVTQVRPDRHDYWIAPNDEVIPKGRSTLRLLVPGKTTVRIPAPSLTGRLTIKLNKRMSNATGALHNPKPDSMGFISDDIPFTATAPMVIVHGVSLPTTMLTVASIEWYCIVPAGEDCGTPHIAVGSMNNAGSVNTQTSWPTPGALHAVLHGTDIGVGQGPVLHYVFAVPAA